MDNIRLMGMEVRRELGIPDDTIGPLSPVMNALQFIRFGLGKSADEIECASDGRPTKRLGVWLQHHYPNGRPNNLVGHEYFKRSDPDFKVGKMIGEWP